VGVSVSNKPTAALHHGFAVLTRRVRNFRKLAGLRVLEYTVPT
jgi:hypothetical protein